MGKWYKSAPCKGILLVLTHVCAAVTAICLVWMLTYPTDGLMGVLMEKPQKEYADSRAFEEQLKNVAGQVAWAEPWWANFETDGAYDENKIVDIEKYSTDSTVSGKNESGLAYRLGELIEWEIYDEYSDVSDTDKEIIVCKKEDETYEYYYMEEFREMLMSGKLKFGNMAQAKEEWGFNGISDMLNALLDWKSGDLFNNIQDSEGKQLYTSCWVYDGRTLNEKYAPVDAENILEIVNENPEWNGRLSEAMEGIAYAAGSLRDNFYQCESVRSSWSEGNTNVSYLLVDVAGEKVYSNRTEYKKADVWKKSVSELKKLGKYVIVTPKLADFETNMNTTAEQWKHIAADIISSEDYVCAFAVDTEYPIQDEFYLKNLIYKEYAPLVRSVFGIGLLGAVVVLVCIVWLTIVSGHSNKAEGICLMAADKVKTELFLAAAGGYLVLSFLGLIAVSDYVFDNRYYSYQVDTAGSSTGYVMAEEANLLGVDGMMLVGAITVCLCSGILILWLGLVRRFKAGTIWKNSLICWMLQFVKSILVHIGIIWKAVLAFAIFVLLHWIALVSWNPGIWIMLMILAEAAAFFFIVREGIGRDRIRKGTMAIAEGEVDFQIPTQGLLYEQKKLAESINKISNGLDTALEESMKNERLKTDLITNVSHDIKTPLTSIINYVELLKRENFDDPKIQNYLKVLEEKAHRLKTLTEDVVEASKVSSGNVKLERMNLNLVELINQTSAEFEDKFADRNLNLILNMPGEPAVIFADGRRMWRVLSNIFNNAAKYAMEGSRVYADLIQIGSEVQFTLKNVSEQPLNISADELTERFIRGDVSRSTEGSGLGLSIAQNLTKLQGGTFELYLDGDLFKVLIRFPKVVQNTEDSFPTEVTELK